VVAGPTAVVAVEGGAVVSSDTRRRLLDAAIETVRQRGTAGTSARVIAQVGDVNQALIFYHFGSVDGLLAEACTSATVARIAAYRERFDEVGSLAELVTVARDLNVQDREQGNASVLAQLLAGAQGDPKLRPAVTESLGLWVTEIERVLERLLGDTPGAKVIPLPELAHTIAATFVGMELMNGATSVGDDAMFAALEQMAQLVHAVVDRDGVLDASVIDEGSTA
jgi:AcrR family transcriptional regulator